MGLRHQIPEIEMGVHLGDAELFVVLGAWLLWLGILELVGRWEVGGKNGTYQRDMLW